MVNLDALKVSLDTLNKDISELSLYISDLKSREELVQAQSQSIKKELEELEVKQKDVLALYDKNVQAELDNQRKQKELQELETRLAGISGTLKNKKEEMLKWEDNLSEARRKGFELGKKIEEIAEEEKKLLERKTLIEKDKMILRSKQEMLDLKEKKIQAEEQRLQNLSQT